MKCLICGVANLTAYEDEIGMDIDDVLGVCEPCLADAARGRAARKEMERLRNIRDDDNSLSGLSDTEDDFLAELESLNQAALLRRG